MIQTRSMLIDLSISRWTAIKHDRKVSAEVDQTHAAKQGGRYNKYLIDKAHLAEIDRIANELRKYHYSRTLPWTDKGHRALPSDLFFEYQQELQRYKQQFQTAVADFVRIYPQLVQDARQRLGTMYRPEDYPQPSELFGMFDISLDIAPVPDANDFRVDVAKEAQDEIRAQITKAVAERQAKMVSDCWTRMREVVGRIADQCSKEKPVIRDSLMDNARDLVSVLDALNVTDDPAITAARNDISDRVIVPLGQLRMAPTVRMRVATAAKEILERIPEC